MRNGARAFFRYEALFTILLHLKLKFSISIHRLGKYYLKQLFPFRRVATCKPGKPRLTSFSETLVLFFIQFFFISENEDTGQTKWSLGLTRKKLAGYAPALSVGA